MCNKKFFKEEEKLIEEEKNNSLTAHFCPFSLVYFSNPIHPQARIGKVFMLILNTRTAGHCSWLYGSQLVQPCTLLYSTVPNCTILYFTLLYFTVMYFTVMYFADQFFTLLQSNVRYRGWNYQVKQRTRQFTAEGSKLELAVHYSTLLYCTLLYSPLLHITVLSFSVHYCTLLYCTLLYSPLLYITVLSFTAHYCTLLFCTLLYSPLLYIAVLSFTVHYCTLLYCTLLYTVLQLEESTVQLSMLLHVRTFLVAIKSWLLLLPSLAANYFHLRQ